jgi:hypothetical protein
MSSEFWNRLDVSSVNREVVLQVAASKQTSHEGYVLKIHDMMSYQDHKLLREGNFLDNPSSIEVSALVIKLDISFPVTGMR